ncbi:hypothetical protein [Hymenobacter rubidus]|uniref:hypothetical protein n=1 Tax=Hymenobacter rubidus TaxID=1441626 RepID=UPI001F26C4FC|nr:hypothetical protein [Hymenobacter rubidus]
MTQRLRYILPVGGLLLATAAIGQTVPPVTRTPGQPPEAAPVPPAPPKPVPYGAGMKVNLSPDGSKYLRFQGWTQVWAQYNENNSNTLRNNKLTSDQLAFSLRRSRLVILAQLNARFLTYIDLGMENQAAVSGGVPNDPNGPGKRSPLYLHQAVAEYRINKYLNIGGGLHAQAGVSRFTAASTASMVAIDIPTVNFPTVDQTDQFSYFLGFYGKGRIGNFDYRLAVDDAFLTNQASNPLPVSATNPSGLRTNVAQFNPRNTSKIYQGYFSYAFLEKEANLVPMTVGTYLGTKRVLNIGAGFHYNANATYSRAADYPYSDLTPQPAGTTPTPKGFDPYSLTTTHDIKLFGADVYYDAPIDTASNTSLTVYGVYYNYDFGPNYVRNVGVINPGTGIGGGTGPASLTGNAFPVIGTGHTYYLQSGLLLPRKLLGPKARLQPYVTYLHNSLEGLLNPDGTRKAVNVYDAGLNLLLDGHNAKITLNYRARPDFSDQVFLPANNGAATVNSVQYRPEVTMQFQVYL